MTQNHSFGYWALKTRGNTPKYGLIFHSSFIGRASARNTGRMAHYLANKCSIASRIDCFLGKNTTAFGEKLREQFLILASVRNEKMNNVVLTLWKNTTRADGREQRVEVSATCCTFFPFATPGGVSSPPPPPPPPPPVTNVNGGRGKGGDNGSGDD
ncbi:hypothetical protein ACSBR1_023869 [Camellia fascicularis]